MAPVLETIIKEVGGKSTSVELDAQEVEDSVKDAVKEAVREVVRDVVEGAVEQGDGGNLLKVSENGRS